MANWLFAQTTHVAVPKSKFACRVASGVKFYISSFIKIGPVVLPPWVVENRPSPLLWPLAYTTACTTVQAVILTETLPNGSVECTWSRQKFGFWPNIWFHRMMWTLRRPVAINTIVYRYPDIDRCLLELVLSTDGGPSSGVLQSRCKSFYGTESHAPVNKPKRRQENII